LSTTNLLDAMIAQSRLSKRQTDKQQKIIETSIKLFAEKGYANTSTSEIAKEAGVAEGTIFRHYGTKDNLLLSVLLPFIKASIPAMAEGVFNEVMSNNTLFFEDFLRALLKNRLEFVHENKEIFQVFIKEILYSEELRKELIPYFSENILQRFGKVLDKYKDLGELSDIPSDILQRMIFTLVGGYFVSRFVLLTDHREFDEDQEIEHLIRFIMDGIKKQSHGS
jgi:AcrR family transcriptional regulator